MKTPIADWSRSRIKHLAQVDYGLGQPPRLSESGVPILRATNINKGKISKAGLIYASLKDLPLDRAPLLRSGEILVVRSGAYTGDSALITDEWAGSAPGYDLRVTPERVEPRYLAYCLLSSVAMQQMDIAKGRAAQPHLNAEELGEVIVELPELSQQRHIANFLDVETARIDTLSSLRRTQSTLLDEREYATVSEILVPGTLSIPTEIWPWVWLPEMPTDRPLVRLGYVCRLQTGLTVDGKREVSGDVVTRPYLRVANVQAGRVDLGTLSEITVPTGIASRSTLRAGDVLMTEGGDLDKLGRGTVWRGEVSKCLHQNHVFALRPENNRLDADYLALMTRTVHGRNYFESTGVKTTNLASTNSNKILSFPIPLPSVTEQRNLARRAQAALDTIATAGQLLDRQLKVLSERRQALITAAVTGHIDVSTASGRGIEE
ncbi:restriction endonuclease subunit S [Streptomyces sp. NBC_00696]|uniref:restriction endonuclease subunit S n=1 Tax=Streptomyces sp. NBC_00696 TaxID=2903672 RepID=UPI002E32DC1A|nr:restriction endonuclease subunit S [Streptomyces sp. NBC_00696]